MSKASFRSNKVPKHKLTSLMNKPEKDIILYDAERGPDTEEENGEVAQEQFMEFEKKLNY